MIPRFYRETPPQYVSARMQMVQGNAQAGIGTALQGLGANVEQAGQTLQTRQNILATSRGARQLEKQYLDRLRKLPERRNELRQITIDTTTGQNVTGYDLETTRFPDALQQDFDNIAATLSPGARDMFERAYNDVAPRWADQIATTIETLELEDADTEIMQLAEQDRTAEAFALLELHGDRFSESHRRALTGRLQAAALDARLKSAQTYLQDVARQRDWEAAAQTIADPEFQRLWQLDVEESAGLLNRLRTFVAHGQVRAQAELEAKRETVRDALADKRAAGELTYQDIDESPLDEAEQRQYVTWMEADVHRRLSGRQVVTDEAVRHDLKARALDIARGREPYADVVRAANEAKASGKLDDDAYRDVLAAARSELSSIQAESVAAASRSAQRQVVTVTDSALERYFQLLESGGPAAKEALARAESQRQFEYRLVDMHDDQLRHFIKADPEATSDTIYRESRRILAGLRQADNAQRRRVLEEWEAADLPAASPWEGPVEGVLPLNPPRTPPPVGLESIWQDLSAQEQATALLLIDRGFEPVDLLEHFRKQQE